MQLSLLRETSNENARVRMGTEMTLCVGVGVAYVVASFTDAPRR